MCECRRCPGPPAPKVLAEIWRIVLDVFGYPSWLLYSSELPCLAHIFKSPVRASFLYPPLTHPHSYPPFLLISSGEYYHWGIGRKSKMICASSAPPLLADDKRLEDFPPPPARVEDVGNWGEGRLFALLNPVLASFILQILELVWRAH